MTTEEIILSLKALKAQIEWEFSLEYQIALEQAMRKLEKDIPKAPLEKGKPDTLGRIFYANYCPNCRKNVIKQKRCDNCGQLLKWEVKE